MSRTSFFALASAILIVAANYPYYLFGPFSAIGWYDERDLIIPLSLITNGSSGVFVPEFAGGTRVDFAQLGLTTYSILTLLNQFFGEQLSLILYRIIGPILFCIFTFLYLPNRKFGKYKLEPTNTLFIKITTLNLIILFGTPYTYGWILGGYGYSLLLAFSAAIIVHSEDVKRSSKILMILIISALQSADISNLSTYLPCFLVSFVIIQFLVGFDGIKFDKIWLLIFTITISTVFSINDVYVLLEMSQNNFSRLNTDVKSFNLFSYFQEKQIPTFSEWFGPISLGSFNPFEIGNQKLFPNSKALIFLLFIVTCVTSWENQSYRFIFIFIAALCCYPIGSTFVSILNFMPNYRYNQVPIFIFPCLAFISFIAAASNNHNNSQNGSLSIIVTALLLSSFVVIVITLALSISAMQKRTLTSIAKGNFWERLEKLEPFHLPQTSRGFVYSHNYEPPIEIFLMQGVHMLDGMRSTFTEGRTNFWFITIPENNAKIHTHRQTAFNLKSHDININTLKLANVEFVFSHGPFYDFDAIQTVELPGLNCERTYVCKFLEWHNIKKVPKNLVNIYKLKDVTPRVFHPFKIVNSINQFDDAQYYSDLKELKACEILTPYSKSKTNFANISLAPSCNAYEYRYYEDGIIIDNPKNGLIVNHSYYNTMRATCGNKEVTLGPINGIMTIVTDIENDCQSVRITF